MKKVYIGSLNPVKINSTREAFQKFFPGDEFEFIGVVTDSRVGKQPMGHEETLRGAFNRSETISKKYKDGNYWVGIEGGIDVIGEEMHVFAWIVIKDELSTGKSCTATFIIPRILTELIIKGYELGEADDLVFGRKNSKHSDGTVGFLTDGIINRYDFYSHATILALIPFKNTQLFKRS